MIVLIKEYLSIRESIDLVCELTGEKINGSTLEELSNVERLTPVFLFSGYVCYPDLNDKTIRYGKMKAYFTHDDFFMHQTRNYEDHSMYGDADVPEWIEIHSPFKIQDIIKKQSEAYSVFDEVFLFKNPPIGEIDKLDDIKYSNIDFDDVRFSRNEILALFDVKKSYSKAQNEFDFYLGAMDKLKERAKGEIDERASRIVEPKTVQPIGSQRLLVGYKLFTPHQLTCLLSNDNPAYNHNYDEYNAYKDMVSNAIETKDLEPINDKEQIPVAQVKIWLAGCGFVYEGFNDNLIKDTDKINQSSQQLIDVQENIVPLATDYDDIQAPSIIYPAEPPKDIKVHTDLGEYQKELITYDAFTPNQIICLILNYPPNSSSSDRQFISYMIWIDSGIKSDELTTFKDEEHNDEQLITAQQVKVWLARNNYIYEGFNDNIPADPVEQVRQLTAQLTDAQATIKQITNDYEKALARIEAKEQSTDSFKMGSPTVEQGEPKTSEQIISEFREQITQLTADNNELKKKLKTVHIELKTAKTSQPSDDDKELAYKSQTKVACMLYAILKENNYDLSPPMGKGLANDLIVNASQVHGTPVTKNFVADWLKRANQAKINLTNK